MIARVRKVAYKLLLPKEAKIHDVFHVFQLKKYHGPLPSNCLELPSQWVMDKKLPEKILSRRMVKRNNWPVTQVLVHWKGLKRSMLQGKIIIS